MSSENNSYKQILKATSIFGGVQVVNILISIIRTKFVALFIGASGLGIFSIFQTTTNLIYTISHLGISSSAIREISIANASEDIKKISRTVSIFFKWVIFTGSLGTLFTVLMAPYLSEVTFGNNQYQYAYMYLSVIILLTAISSSQITLLKGMRKVKDLAKANVIGSLLGLIISVPLFYFLRKDGIVLSMIVSAILAVICTWYFTRKIKTEKVVVTHLETFKEGKGMVFLGIMMTISGFLSLLNNFILNTYITEKSGLEVLGLYQSGISITTKYVSMVFTAMAMDFYPRLSVIHEDNTKIKQEVNQQIEIGLLIIAPILILLISTMPIVINLLYSKEFLPIVEFVQWLSLGILFKTFSWPIGYILLAKRHSGTFLISEIIGLAILLSCNIIGFNYWGLIGLGKSIAISNALYLIIILIITHFKYSFSIEKHTFLIFLVKLGLCLAALLLAILLGFPNAYFTGIALFCLSALMSLKILNTKTGIIQKIKTKFTRK